MKFSSTCAETRYEYDSQNTTDLSLTKGRYYRMGDPYIDEHVAPNKEEPEKSKFNTYDSMDKYVFVVDFEPSIDHKTMFDISWRNGIHTHSYNILGDAGYIPHFAYQSLVKYADRDGGTAYTWRNKYLKTKDHLQFELLGLDDKGVKGPFGEMQRMIVDDITDNCKTLLCPAKMMDDIYRIWCEVEGVKRRLYPGEEDPYGYKKKYETYFPNEYVDYTNP